jgi:hypothetical protein
VLPVHILHKRESFFTQNRGWWRRWNIDVCSSLGVRCFYIDCKLFVYFKQFKQMLAAAYVKFLVIDKVLRLGSENVLDIN